MYQTVHIYSVLWYCRVFKKAPVSCPRRFPHIMRFPRSEPPFWMQCECLFVWWWCLSLCRLVISVSVLVFFTYIVLVFREQNMVQRIQEIVTKYEDRLREMQSVPKLSYGRRLVRTDGAPNRMFFTCLFCHHELAIQFLKDVGLIRSKVQCNTCERDMTW